MSELKTYEGKCKFCKSKISVMAESQSEANNESTINCSCEESQFYREECNIEDLITKLFVTPDDKDIWDIASEEELSLIRHTAKAVMLHHIVNATIELSTTTVKIKKTKTQVVINRILKLEREGEA